MKHVDGLVSLPPTDTINSEAIVFMEEAVELEGVGHFNAVFDWKASSSASLWEW